MIERSVIDAKLKLVAARMKTLKNNGMKEVFPISLIDIDCWEWPQGVGIFGLYKYYTITKDEEILNFLLKWYDERIEEGILEKNVNTTSPMLTLTYLYEITKKESYLALIKEWADWIMEEKGLIRTGDGLFQHMITGSANDGEILIDTIFMTLLFLGRASKILERKDYLDEVNYQILSHIKYLFNKDAGMFYHGYNFDLKHNYGKIHWGRGNCWYTVAILEYLDEFEIDPTLRRAFLSIYTTQVKTLKGHANKENNLWHTVIDDPKSYIEISGSAGFLCGILKGIRQGVLPKDEYQALADNALESILKFISEDGTVENVSYGTPIGYDKQFYLDIAITPMTYGQALMILCLTEALNHAK
ncbi:MAG: glycoside hydrolase family 88 protein [Defluviitaleaceae bacterium]|nr:glycoside hydrolase family 88 protein [Defluviitaleaceae bacterium]